MDRWEIRYLLLTDELCAISAALEEHFGTPKSVPDKIVAVMYHAFSLAHAFEDCVRDDDDIDEEASEVGEIPEAFVNAFGLTGEVSAGVVARELGVGRATVNRWLTGGALPAVGRTAAGHYRVDMKVVTTLKALRQSGVHLNTHTVKASCISLQ